MIDALREGALTGTAEEGGDAGVGGERIKIDRRGTGEGEGLDAGDVGKVAREGVIGEEVGGGDHEGVASGADDGVHRKLGTAVDDEEVATRRIDEESAQEVCTLGDGVVATAAEDGLDASRVG